MSDETIKAEPGTCHHHPIDGGPLVIQQQKGGRGGSHVLRGGMGASGGTGGPIIIQDPDGDELLRIEPDGKVVFGDKFDAAIATRIFWERLGGLHPSARDRALVLLADAVTELGQGWHRQCTETYSEAEHPKLEQLANEVPSWNLLAHRVDTWLKSNDDSPHPMSEGKALGKQDQHVLGALLWEVEQIIDHQEIGRPDRSWVNTLRELFGKLSPEITDLVSDPVFLRQGARLAHLGVSEPRSRSMWPMTLCPDGEQTVELTHRDVTALGALLWEARNMRRMVGQLQLSESAQLMSKLQAQLPGALRRLAEPTPGFACQADRVRALELPSEPFVLPNPREGFFDTLLDKPGTDCITNINGISTGIWRYEDGLYKYQRSRRVTPLWDTFRIRSSAMAKLVMVLTINETREQERQADQWVTDQYLDDFLMLTPGVTRYLVAPRHSAGCAWKQAWRFEEGKYQSRLESHDNVGAWRTYNSRQEAKQELGRHEIAARKLDR